MLSHRNNQCRSVPSSAMGLKTPVTPALTARSVNSRVPPPRPASARPRQPSRSLSAESLHAIPQILDIESQFQAVLGKCLFSRAVHLSEEGQAGSARGPPPRPYSASPGGSRPGSHYGSAGAKSPLLNDRTTLKLRPTRCNSPLVKGSHSFDTYISNGSVDQLAVAKTHGAVESPKPCIRRCLRRVKTASDQNLNDFSLKAEFTDKLREGDRKQYWRRKKEEKVIEEETRERQRREKAEMMIILADMKKDYEERKAKEALELRRLQLEAERIAKEKQEELTAAESTENQLYADDISVVSSSSKSSKKRSAKRGKASRRDKAPRKAKSAGKSAKKKSSVAPSLSDADGDRSGSNTPQPILKSGEGRPIDEGSGGTERGKRVTFREKLASTRTIRPHRPVSPRKASPRKAFPGSASSESRGSASPTPGDRRRRPGGSKGTKRGARSGTNKKKTKEPTPPVEPAPEPEPPVPEPPPPELVVEPEPEEPKEPEVIIVEEPPEFCPASEYRTRKQMVEEWLYYRSSSAACRANPPIL